MKTHLRFQTTFLTILITLSIYSQVTIGSAIPTNKGALLDLKEEGQTTKGLLLPRVKLTFIEPTTPSELAASIGNNGNWLLKEHTGLTVYNSNYEPSKCLNEKYYSQIIKGVYVWDGAMWRRMPETKEGDVRSITYNDVNTFTMTYADETETYYFASFGEAGVWMTQNLRTHYTSNGLRIPNTASASFTGHDAIGNRVYSLGYPMPNNPPSTITNPGDATDPSIYNEYKEYGVYYNWHTATDFQNCSERNQAQTGLLRDQPPIPGENEMESREATGKIKGICPEGWHLPSDREWNLLEKYMTENAATLTQISAQNKIWDNSFESRTQWRGNDHGAAMQSTNKVYNSGFSLNYANSKTAQNGGFDALLVGCSYKGRNSEYGRRTFFWSSSTDAPNAGHTIVWIRALDLYTSEANRVSSDCFDTLFSVRCKKD